MRFCASGLAAASPSDDTVATGVERAVEDRHHCLSRRARVLPVDDHDRDKLEAMSAESGWKPKFQQRSRWKTNREQRNVASPWQAKRKQRMTICARRFCASFRSRSIGRWIKSTSPMRLVMAQRAGTKCAGRSVISNRKAKSRAFEKIGTSYRTQPISLPEH